jgi:hypothetical protein
MRLAYSRPQRALMDQLAEEKLLKNYGFRRTKCTDHFDWKSISKIHIRTERKRRFSRPSIQFEQARGRRVRAFLQSMKQQGEPPWPATI